MTIDSTLPILVSGPMAVGKSSAGALAAASLGRAFVDLDRAVEIAAGSSIPQIFAVSGEARFRELERQVLRSHLASGSPQLIALGGGTLVDPTMRTEAFENAIVVSLVAPPSLLASRIPLDGSRPLFDGVAAGDVGKLLLETNRARKSAYAMAHAFVDASSGSVEEVGERIAHAAQDSYVGVSLAELSYAARFTKSPWRALAETVAALGASSVFLVSDSNVSALYGASCREALAARGVPAAGEFVFPAGEENKTLAQIEQALAFLVRAGADRGSLLIGLGGGVVTDMTGFTAALFSRGIRWVAVPTTLLAMVDASVGGKTGVDFIGAKNLVGAIHQPRAVVVSPDLSRSESDRGARGGVAELVKTLALGDAARFEECERIATALSPLERLSARHSEWLNRAIVESVRIKARIVSADPLETGQRAVLNFGHTLGHAFEAAGGLSQLTHGEAVAVGMVTECAIGARLGVTEPSLGPRIARLLEKLGLPIRVSRDVIEGAAPWLRNDKKRTGDKLRLALLSALGEPLLVDVSHEALAGLVGNLSSELWPPH